MVKKIGKKKTKNKSENNNNNNKKELNNKSNNKIKKRNKDNKKSNITNEISKEVIKEEDNQCIICLADYDNEYHIKKKLKCKHSLCESCFNQWYKIKESCPVCRKNLFNVPSDRPDFYSIVKDLYLHHDTYFSRDY